jgi:hypothetical protein
MSKSLLIILLALILAAPLWSQETETGSISGDPPPEVGETSGEAEEPDDSAEPQASEEAEEIDDADLDEQTYEEDEDDFVPTEEIPVDQPIPFPSNI